ncbi:MAG: hypothetical protein ABW023_16120 [Sphingomonas sp.]
MQLSSVLCRAQESRQNALAAGTTLSNVKSVATLAAAAWAKEALAAEKREQRLTRRQSMAEPAPELHSAMPRPQDPPFSENPDQGLAD